MSEDCQCDCCKTACQNRPGWFAPGEIEQAAAHKGLSLKDFFNRFLAVDWWQTDEKAIFVIAPAIKGSPTGQEYPAQPTGQCIFYENSLCSIHEAKPSECRFYIHDSANEDNMEHRRQIVEVWKVEKNQEQIVELLGREPEEKSFFDWLYEMRTNMFLGF